MGKSKKGICVLLTVVLIINAVACFTFESEAASARSILNKAYKNMAKYSSVFYKYSDTYEVDNTKYTYSGCSISDNSISYTVDANEEIWHIKARRYRKASYSNAWTIEKVDEDNSKPDRYYGKKLFQYAVKNLKNPKIIKNTKTAYVIVGKARTKDFSKIEVKKKKKDNVVVGMTYYYNDYTTTNNYGEEVFVKNPKWVITNLCYGNTKLKAPKF